MDTTPIGLLAQAAMEKLDELDLESECIRSAALVIDVDGGDRVLVASTEDRPWVQVALLQEAIWSIEEERDDGDSSD